MVHSILITGVDVTQQTGTVLQKQIYLVEEGNTTLPALACKLNGLDGGGVAGARGDPEGGHQLLGVGVQDQDLRRQRSTFTWSFYVSKHIFQ